MSVWLMNNHPPGRNPGQRNTEKNMSTEQAIEAHNALLSLLTTPEVTALEALTQKGLDDAAAGRDTAAAKKVRAITHEIYFRQTGFANSGGREYMWCFAVSNAAKAAKDNSPDRCGKYLSPEEATHWLREAASEVQQVIAAARAIKA